MNNDTTADGFDVHCRCGAAIHTSAVHVGRTITCRCGRAVPIERPAVSASAPVSGSSRSAKRAERASEMFVMGREELAQGSRRRRRSASPAAASAGVKARRVHWRVPGGVSAVLLAVAEAWWREWHHPRAGTRFTARAMAAYTALLAVTWLLLITTSERWLPTTLLLYGPRAVVLLPLLLLVPAALLFARTSLLLAVPALWLGACAIMGFRFGLSFPAGGAGEPLRVMSLNAQGGGLVIPRLDALLAEKPDLIGVQECSEELATALRLRGRYSVVRDGSLCTASRWPVTFVDSMPRLAFQRIQSLGYGGSGLVLRYRVRHPSQPFQLVNLHLETPRKGLQGLTGDDGLIPDDGNLTRSLPSSDVQTAASTNAQIRLRESERASGWAASKRNEGPLVITGDFNQPVESTIYRAYWSLWENAFEKRGRGFGYTKVEGTLLRARIDHVLTWPDAFEVVRARVGPHVGSDHRPVIAELRFR
jgi:vancomycin resistance protein VanJ